MGVIEIASNGSEIRQSQRAWQIGPLVVDPYLRMASLHGEPLELTAKEYSLLCLLASEPLRCFTREQLLERVWAIPEGWNGHTRTLDSHACRLRRKLGPPFIVNVWGVGYRLLEGWLPWE